MKCIKHNLPNSNIRIKFLSDWHIGSKKCNWNQIHKDVNECLDEDTYCVLLGDIIDNATRTSVGDIYEEPLSPMEQMKLAVETLEPIKDKILGIVSGNHEQRSYKTEGQDVTWYLAKCLGCIDVYDPIAVLLFIRFGSSTKDANRKQCYTLYATHGAGGGRTIGAKANALEKRGQIVNADIVAIGHTHQPLSWKECSYEICYGNSSVKLKETTFVNVASALNYEAYAEQFGLKPSCCKSPEVYLKGDKKSVQVLL